MDGQDRVEVSRRTLLGAVLTSVPAWAGDEAGVETGPAPDLSALPRTRVEH